MTNGTLSAFITPVRDVSDMRKPGGIHGFTRLRDW